MGRTMVVQPADRSETAALRERVKRLEDMLLCQQCDEPGSGIRAHRTLGPGRCLSCGGTGLRMEIVNRDD